MAEKKDKEAVNYTPIASMASQRCDKCIHFRPMYETCELVNGHVKPEAWCELFRKK